MPATEIYMHGSRMRQREEQALPAVRQQLKALLLYHEDYTCSRISMRTHTRSFVLVCYLAWVILVPTMQDSVHTLWARLIAAAPMPIIASLDGSAFTTSRRWLSSHRDAHSGF